MKFSICTAKVDTVPCRGRGGRIYIHPPQVVPRYAVPGGGRGRAEGALRGQLPRQGNHGHREVRRVQPRHQVSNVAFSILKYSSHLNSLLSLFKYVP